ncbi:hypothetical protein ILUMI_01189 [Ignelater luminosus]|uniref:Trichohyalin-plectin-homology domain-containing protein n=1 Tax=Ignelater luminosus TaxID=2038154 RepID=A0A8K0DKK7_IGNLU|nr:hypothetical protein ILUMI_01189 [Ignelater luminosus]
MESRWYVSPGQTLQTTKIEDRSRALHIKRNLWKNITAHLDRNRLTQEAIDKEKARKKFLKEGSEQMTKNWENSVVNRRKRQEEERKARLEKVETDRLQRFMELSQEQEEIRRKVIADARRAIYIEQGHSRDLTGALILSEVIHEREKQKELEQRIKQHDMEAEAKYALQVKEAAEQEKSENLEKERQLMKQKLELKRIYLQEQASPTNPSQFIPFNYPEQEKRTQTKNEFQKFYEKQQKAKELAQNVEKEQDLVIDIYSKAKHKINCLRKKKEREIQAALQARRAAASKKVVADAKAKTEDVERFIRKAIEEREQEELERLKTNKKYRDRLIQDRQEDRRKFIECEEKRKFEEAELRKWLLLNRVKRDSATKEYEENKRQTEWQGKLDYRKALFEQMDEDEERRRIEKADNQGYDVTKFAEDDRKFFEYSKECLDYLRKRGRSTLPVERLILEYKKENRLSIPTIKICEDSSSSQNESSKCSIVYTPTCKCFK